MISSTDPWLDFRKNTGEFRKWLHVWSYTGGSPRPLYDEEFHYHCPWAPLPWVIREPPSGEILLAMRGIGMTARWPGEWPRFDPSRVPNICSVLVVDTFYFPNRRRS